MPPPLPPPLPPLPPPFSVLVRSSCRGRNGMGAPAAVGSSTRCSACSLAPGRSGSGLVTHACCNAPCRRVAPLRAHRLLPRPPQPASCCLLHRRRHLPHHRRLARRRIRRSICLRERAPPLLCPCRCSACRAAALAHTLASPCPHHPHHAPTHRESPSHGRRLSCHRHARHARRRPWRRRARPPSYTRHGRSATGLAPVAATGPYAHGSRSSSTQQLPPLQPGARPPLPSPQPQAVLVAGGLLVHEPGLRLRLLLAGR